MTAPTGHTIRAALIRDLDGYVTVSEDRQVIAAALTPTVQQLIAQAVTTALNDAADEFDSDDAPVDERPADVLRARAAAYTAQATRPDATVADDDGEDRYGLTRSDYHGQMH